MDTIKPTTPDAERTAGSLPRDGWTALVAKWRYKAGIVRALQPVASLVDERTEKMTGLVADTWECAANELEQAAQSNEKGQR